MPGTEPVQFSSVHLRAVGSSMVRWQRRSGRKARWCVAYVSAAPRNEAQGGRAPQQLCIRRRRLDAGDAQDPSRTIAASERALNGAIVKNEARLKGEAPRERYIEDWEVVEVLSLPSVRKRGSVLAIQHYIRLKRLTGLRRSDLLRLQVSPCCEDGTSGQTRPARRSEAWRNSRSGARLLVVRPRFSLQQRKSSSTKGKVPSGHEQHQNPRSTD
jgi:hypothetical protein